LDTTNTILKRDKLCARSSAPRLKFLMKENSLFYLTQGGHFSGKPGNVREFGYCQGNVGEFHIVWNVGTLIPTFAHIVVAILVFSMTNVNQIFC
jgi:hypothetical protein